MDRHLPLPPMIARVSPRLVFAIGAGVYLLLCLLAYCVARPTTALYFTDYWEHRAIIGEVIRNGTRLTDPIYGEAASSRQFTPWSLALGYTARVTGCSVDAALAAGAMLVSLLFVVGVHGFARAYYAHRWAPAVLLAALTCAWGVPPLIWTGFHPLRSQMHGNYYPAAFVFALTFIAWTAVVRLLRAPGNTVATAGRALVLVAIVAVGLITHPLNAGFLLAGAGALIVFDAGVSAARRAGVTLVLTAGILTSTAWPYFNPLGLAEQGVARGQATFNNFDFFFSPLFVAAMLWPAAFALPALPFQLRSSRTRMPALAFLVIAAAYVAGGIANVSVSHRFLAYVALALQMMLTWLVLDRIDGRPSRPFDRLPPHGWGFAARMGGVLIVLHVLLAIQQLFSPWALTSYPYPPHPVDAELRRVRATLPRDARILGWESAALVLPAYGVKVAAFPRPMPLSPSDAARQADVRRFFRYRTPDCERRAIAARWGATHIAWIVYEVRPWVQRELERMGPVERPAGPWRIMRSPAPCIARSGTSARSI